jgi:mannose-6-phosphate isomerase-like protein (cupin superfamily)
MEAVVIPIGELDPTKHSHEFVGADHGDVPFSVILVHTGPGGGPAVHRHPYAEVFVVEAGEATFTLGDRQVVVPGGHVVVGPPDMPHGFTNTGTDELRLTAIHGNPRFITEWLEAHDGTWVSKPGR